MARTRNPEQRIAELLEAGTAVFRRKGFRRTQMSDIADQMNCSTGTLYNYIDSKEALFEHAVVSGFTRSLPQSETLPLGFPKPAAVAVIKRRSQEIAAGSALDQANRREDAEDPIEEVTLIVTTFFLFFSDYHPVLDMIEASHLDYPDVATAYLEARRDLVFDPWMRWITRRQEEGLFRRDIDPFWTTRYLIEILAWAAWKARDGGDPYDEDKARDAIIKLTLSSLLRDEDRP